MDESEVSAAALATIIVPQRTISDLVSRVGPYRTLEADDVRDVILSIAFDAIYTRRTLVVQLRDADEVGLLFSDIKGQWIFSDRRLLSVSAATPFLLWADGEAVPDKIALVKAQAALARDVQKYAGHPLTLEASFELIIRHYVHIKGRGPH
jgi:hypothetical protein